jgi:hypothetical protein
VILLLASIVIPGGAGATYAGDRPLNASYQADNHGGYLFSLGDSRYSGTLEQHATYNVSYSLSLPDDSTVRFQRLYVYWAWSKIDQNAVYPTFRMRDSRQPSTDLSLVSRYTDSKGFTGTYDFYTGVDAFELFPLHAGSNNFTVTLEQNGLPNSSVLVFGSGVLSVYESPASPRTLLWVREGNDLMYSSYGVSPEMASNEMIFEGELPKGRIEQADLFLVAPSGGYSRDLESDINKLMVNRLDEEKTPPLIRTIFSLLFPNYQGKEWSDIFNTDNSTQIGFETKDIKPYLKAENNKVTVRDQGDYFQLTNVILSIRMAGENT